jgi:hypothetical protein
MSRVVLSRLWYIFPPDDQDLRPEEFARKVKSYAKTLSAEERSALFAFLVVQYEAFRKQLDLLFAHASVSTQEYCERAERLERYLEHLHAAHRGPDLPARPSIPAPLAPAQSTSPAPPPF